MKKIRVLVVDDSSFMRRLIKEMIESDPEFEVVGVATNGQEAVFYNHLYKPDCITMDIEMPVMNGLLALKQIMQKRPVPVIMLSSLTQSGRQITIEAMMNGAFDYIPKPSGSLSLDIESVKAALHTKLRHAVQAKLVSPHLVHDLSQKSKPNRGRESAELSSTTSNEFICIGSSTGGPRALQTVLSGLPDDLSVPVLIVQHMPPHFTTTLAARLNQVCQLTVKEAEQGEFLENGVVYIAPGGHHMKVEKKRERWAIGLDDSPPVKGLKPCFDVLLESLVPLKAKVTCAILTGMGSDGSKGLKMIKQTLNVHAIAESEMSAIIYGMPKAAVQTGLIDQILDLNDIAHALVDHLSHLRG